MRPKAVYETFKEAGVRWFDLDQQQNWPTDTYDPEMHRFAAKLEAMSRPPGSPKAAR